MSKNERAPVITGNWKMYKTIEQAFQFLESLPAKIGQSQVRVFLAVPFTAIYQVKKKIQELSLPITIGAQNMNDASEGAFTGEIAAVMLQEAGADFVLLGHSERRRLFGETDSFVNKKVLRALSQGITPTLCIGESIEERNAGQTFDVVRRQVMQGLMNIDKNQAAKVMLAYEPVWAIGTGQVATAAQAQEVHRFCREVMHELFDSEVANKVIIQYGGSVKPENAMQLLAQEDVDGFLVGGASLDVDSFSEIIKNCGTVL